MEEKRGTFQQEIHGHYNATSVYGDASVYAPVTFVSRTCGRSDNGDLIQSGRPLPISEWHLESFQLGDKEAANFPYVIAPIEDVFAQMVQALEQMRDTAQANECGILVTGESNVGKTRLAIEALKQMLPDWYLMRWLPGYIHNGIPLAESFKGLSLVLFLDDLQDYVLTPVREIQAHTSNTTAPLFRDQDLASQQSAILHTLIDTLLHSASCLIIIAVCRDENLNQVQFSLGWLCDMLIKVSFPGFSADPRDPLASRAIADLQQKGAIPIEDWDGTIGSLILGLSRKYQLYQSLLPQAQTVLRAMKLLLCAGTPIYTEQRIRATCARVFAVKPLLEDERFWQETIDQLTSTQFIKEEANARGEIVYTLRKDSYFEKVIVDYPVSNRPQQIIRHLTQLQEIFRELEDSQSLFNLSFSFLHLKQIEHALTTINLTLSLDTQNAAAWHNKATCLARLDRNEEALAAFEYVLTLDPTNAYTWSNRGACLATMNRVSEALDSFEHALSLDPSALIWHDKGFCLLGSGSYQEALEAFEHSLQLDSNDASAWRGKARCLLGLENFEQALNACDSTLCLDPGSAETWNIKGLCHSHLSQFREAYVALECVLLFDLNDVQAWHNKGTCLWQLGQYQEALESLEQAIKLHSDYAYTWFIKGECLFKLENYEGALKSFEQATRLDPHNVQFLGHAGACLYMLGRLDEALTTLDMALTLDPNDTYAREGKEACLHRQSRREETLASSISTRAFVQSQSTRGLLQPPSINSFDRQQRKRDTRKNTKKRNKRRKKR